MYPVLFHIGHYPVHTYGIVLTIAFLTAILRAYSVSRRRMDMPGALKPDDILDVGVWMILCGIVGARLLFVLLDINSYRGQWWSALELWQGGISFHGGLAGGLIALVWFCRARRLSVLQVADLFAPSVMIAYAIGRIGCFFNGCCYGRPTAMPWGVRFHDGNIWTPPSHPTQLYASAMSFVFFGILVWLEGRQKFYGQLMCWYGIFASIERFIMEIWRAGATSDVFALGLTDTQWFCMALFIVSASGLIYLTRHARASGVALKLREARGH